MPRATSSRRARSSRPFRRRPAPWRTPSPTNPRQNCCCGHAILTLVRCPAPAGRDRPGAGGRDRFGPGGHHPRSHPVSRRRHRRRAGSEDGPHDAGRSGGRAVRHLARSCRRSLMAQSGNARDARARSRQGPRPGEVAALARPRPGGTGITGARDAAGHRHGGPVRRRRDGHRRHRRRAGRGRRTGLRRGRPSRPGASRLPGPTELRTARSGPPAREQHPGAELVALQADLPSCGPRNSRSHARLRGGPERPWSSTTRRAVRRRCCTA